MSRKGSVLHRLGVPRIRRDVRPAAVLQELVVLVVAREVRAILVQHGVQQRALLDGGEGQAWEAHVGQAVAVAEQQKVGSVRAGRDSPTGVK